VRAHISDYGVAFRYKDYHHEDTFREEITETLELLAASDPRTSDDRELFEGDTSPYNKDRAPSQRKEKAPRQSPQRRSYQCHPVFSMLLVHALGERVARRAKTHFPAWIWTAPNNPFVTVLERINVPLKRLSVRLGKGMLRGRSMETSKRVRTEPLIKGARGIAATSLKAGYSLVNQTDRTPYADLRVSLQKV
jgi:hypothetical protein